MKLIEGLPVLRLLTRRDKRVPKQSQSIGCKLFLVQFYDLVRRAAIKTLFMALCAEGLKLTRRERVSTFCISPKSRTSWKLTDLTLSSKLIRSHLVTRFGRLSASYKLAIVTLLPDTLSRRQSPYCADHILP